MRSPPATVRRSGGGDMESRMLRGDCLDVLATLPAAVLLAARAEDRGYLAIERDAQYHTRALAALAEGA